MYVFTTCDSDYIAPGDIRFLSVLDLLMTQHAVSCLCGFPFLVIARCFMMNYPLPNCILTIKKHDFSYDLYATKIL